MQLTNAEKGILKKIHKDLTQHFTQHFTIADLCERYPISQTKLLKGFKLLYGVTIYRYHLEVCMTFARDQLLKGIKVTDLMIMLNYSTHGSFARAFRKVYDTSPSEYRFA